MRYEKNHLWNDLWSSADNQYCVRAGTHASILLENGVFFDVTNPQEFNSANDQGSAFIRATGNAYANATGTEAPGRGGTPFAVPPYPYLLDATDSLRAAIESGAGPH